MSTTAELPMRSLSPSKIDLAMRCPKQFKHRYVEKLPESSSGILHAGIVFHDVMEFAQREQLLGKKLPSAKDLDDRYLQKWDGQKKETEEKENFICWEYNEGDPEEQVKKQTRELVNLAYVEVLPHIKPQLVEESFYFEVDRNGSGLFRVYGRIDYMDKDLVLADWKTAKDKVSRNAEKMGLPMMGYSVWHQEYTGEEITQAKKIFLVRRARKHKVEVRKYSIEHPHREWFRDCAAETWKMVRGDGYPPNTTTWGCSQKFCSFYQLCQGDIQ